jgi:hypothetical protein
MLVAALHPVLRLPAMETVGGVIFCVTVILAKAVQPFAGLVTITTYIMLGVSAVTDGVVSPFTVLFTSFVKSKCTALHS